MDKTKKTVYYAYELIMHIKDITYLAQFVTISEGLSCDKLRLNCCMTVQKNPFQKPSTRRMILKVTQREWDYRYLIDHILLPISGHW